MPKGIRSCVVCGAAFEAARVDSRHCGKVCRAKSNPRLCEIEDCHRPHLAKGRCRKHYLERSPNKEQWKRGNPETRRASLRRKTQKRRALIFDPSAEDIDRDEVGERDRWICGLCFQAVNRSLPYPHPLSASLDHILPLSLGGRHVLSNVQISHLTCNTAKGNRLSEQVHVS